MSKQFLLHKESGHVYAMVKATAEQIREGFLDELMIVEENDERVLKFFGKDKKDEAKPARRKAVDEPVELPASTLTSAAAK